MKDNKYLGFEKFVVLLCLISAIVLSFVALLIPPPGIISNSVLILIAEVLIFCGSVLGIKISAIAAIEKMLNNEETKKRPAK